MTSQLFKEKYPQDKFFEFLDNYCEKSQNYYKVSKIAYKKAKLEGGVAKLFEDLKKYYHKSKHFYVEREDNYKNLITVLRQICKHHLIAYTSNIKYSKSKYEIVYYIYFEP
jgi:hypothetical protein